jgi:hypothetical protein
MTDGGRGCEPAFPRAEYEARLGRLPRRISVL